MLESIRMFGKKVYLGKEGNEDTREWGIIRNMGIDGLKIFMGFK